MGASMDNLTSSTAAVSTLTLTDFRSYKNLKLSLSGNAVPIVLTGANGAGKTNILEAISFLSPGRGLRGSALGEITHFEHDNMSKPQEQTKVWGVAATMSVDGDDIRLGTGLDPNVTGNAKRLVKIDGVMASSSNELGRVAAISWLTPQMDRLFIEGASSRRRFLDRLVLGLYPDHSRQVGAYERVMRERNRLFADKGIGADGAWLSALEAQMAEHAVAIALARIDFTSQLAGQIEEADKKATALSDTGEAIFPKALMALDGWLENMLLGDMPPVEVEEAYKQELKSVRSHDAATGRAQIGPHKTDLLVTHAPKAMPADVCSTGEQKALLIALILANARLKQALTGTPPLMLLDEIAAHLDERRRAALFEALTDIGGQCWMTGTDRSLFSALEGVGEFFEVANGNVTPSDIE